MASSGFMMSGGPGGPNPLIPHSAQVAGMNCIGPRAPALDGPLLAPSPLSIWPIPASTVQDIPGHYFAAEALKRFRELAGAPAGMFVATGVLLAVTKP